jgi:hypothetical protein
VALAGRMNSAAGGTVLAGHVLLALLEFDERYGVAAENAVQCAGLAVLQRTAVGENRGGGAKRSVETESGGGAGQQGRSRW